MGYQPKVEKPSNTTYCKIGRHANLLKRDNKANRHYLSLILFAQLENIRPVTVSKRAPLSARGSQTSHIEKHVGRRIRERRTLLGLTQQQLARHLGITYQQAHKYEHGINRVSAGRLYQFAQVLQVDVTYFYDGLGDSDDGSMSEHQRLSLELARNFSKICDLRQREALAQLIRVLAGREGTG